MFFHTTCSKTSNYMSYKPKVKQAITFCDSSSGVILYWISLHHGGLLVLTGLLWGCTNPFIRSGTRGLREVSAKSRLGQAWAEIVFLATNWRYTVPFAVNQLGSLSYLLAVRSAPLSLAVPMANSLAFAFTALVGSYVGSEEPLDAGSMLGIGLIAVGTALCCWDENIKPLSGQFRPIHGTTRVGDREVVGHGWNGVACYKDDAHFPFPSIRFKENTGQIMALRKKEKGDWKALSVSEKKALYRASFCQTFAEFQHPTGQWKLTLGGTLFLSSLAFWMVIFFAKYVYTPLPASLSLASRRAQLRRMLDLHVNPIDGLTSQWDYDNDCWKSETKKSVAPPTKAEPVAPSSGANSVALSSGAKSVAPSSGEESAAPPSGEESPPPIVPCGCGCGKAVILYCECDE